MSETKKDLTKPAPSAAETAEKSQANAPVEATKEVSATSKATKPARAEKEHFAKNETKFVKKQPGQRSRGRNRSADKKQQEYEEKIIDIARVTTVVKGGRRFSFSAVVVVGNKKGKVGIGHGKANEVPDAIKKAVKNAQNNLIEVPIVNKSTIPHEVKAKFLASRVMIKPAPKGKGIVASGSVRMVVELAGITDIYTKSYGSRTKQNAAKAVLKALKQLRTVQEIAELRGVEVEHLLKR